MRGAASAQRLTGQANGGQGDERGPDAVKLGGEPIEADHDGSSRESSEIVVMLPAAEHRASSADGPSMPQCVSVVASELP